MRVSAWIRVADAPAVTAAPLPVTLGGQRLVVLRLAPAGPVRAFLDHCPHRLVPLSARTGVDGRLRCAYHGWEFSDTGRCVELPSAGPGVAGPPRARRCTAPRRYARTATASGPASYPEPEPEPRLLTNWTRALRPRLAPGRPGRRGRRRRPVAGGAAARAAVAAAPDRRRLVAQPEPAGLTERWGLVWLAPREPLGPSCSATRTRRTPAYVGAWLPPARTEVNAGFVADNFLDVAHFPFVHAGTFGAGEDKVVEPAEVVTEPDGCRSVQEQWFDNPVDPGVAAGLRPVRQRRRATYVYRAPFQLLLRLEELDAGAVKTILFFAQPEELRQHPHLHEDAAARHRRGSRGPGPETVAREVAFEEAVLAEDLALQRGMVLPGLPLRLRDELHVRADRLGVALRRLLAEFVTRAAPGRMVWREAMSRDRPAAAQCPAARRRRADRPGGRGDGRLVAPDDGEPAAEVIDLAGRLVTPPLVEPHIHLDAVLTVGQPRPNRPARCSRASRSGASGSRT